MTTTLTVTPAAIGTTDDPSVDKVNHLLVQYAPLSGQINDPSIDKVR